MKERYIFLIVVVAFVLVGLIAGFSTFTIQQHTVVHATIEKVALQFTSAKNWKYWHPVVSKDTDLIKITAQNKQQEIVLPNNISYQIEIINPAAILIQKNNQGKTTKSLLSALP